VLVDEVPVVTQHVEIDARQYLVTSQLSAVC
jgi:hypothetical protein